MNREQIKKIGLEAGISSHDFGLASEEEWKQVERFVALVISVEREACAKCAELVAKEIDDTNGTATYIAKGIRARGQECRLTKAI